MDDDVIPSETALAELIDASRHFDSPAEIGFLISAARTPDGLENNVPHVDMRRDRSNWKNRPEPEWGHMLEHGMVRVRNAGLTSILIPRTTIEACGVPSGDFAVLGEDADYTLRISAWRPGYLVGRSRVLHKRSISGYIHVLVETNEARLEPLLLLLPQFLLPAETLPSGRRPDHTSCFNRHTICCGCRPRPATGCAARGT